MSILRKQRQRTNFTVLDNNTIQDRRLSWAGRGMLAFLLSKPDGWEVREANLVNESEAPRQGLEAVRAILEHLEEAGYLRRGWENDERGFRRRVTEVADHPAFQPTGVVLSDVGKTDVGFPDAIVRTEDKQEPISAIASADADAVAAARSAPARRDDKPETSSPMFAQVFDAICRVRRVQRKGQAGAWVMNEESRSNTRRLASELTKINLPWYHDSEVKTRQGFPTVDGKMVLDAGAAWYHMMADRLRVAARQVDPPTIRQLRDWIPQYVGRVEVERADDAEKAAQRVAMDAGASEAAQERESPQTGAAGGLDAVWSELAGRLRLQLVESTFSRWIEPLEADHIEGSVLVVRAPNKPSMEWVRDRMLPAMRSAASEMQLSDVRVICS